MKKDIHPKMHDITVELTDGEKIVMKTVYGKPGDIVKLDIDPKTHPAWRKDSAGPFINLKDNKISKFNERFGSLFDSAGSNSKKGKKSNSEDNK